MRTPIGHDEEPSAAQLERWRQTFVAEFGAARRRRRVRRFGLAAGSAAAAALAAVLLWPGAPTAPTAPVARVAVAFGGVVVLDRGEVQRSLEPGDVVQAGERVQSGQRSGAGVFYAGGEVRLDEQTVVVFGDGLLELVRGGLYLDSKRGPAGGPSALRVRTPAGVISHVGTQFLVRVRDAEVTAAVREGGIVLEQGARRIRIDAGEHGARRLVVAATGEVREEDAAATGDSWAWALRSAPGMSLPGKTAHAVLRWSAREQGRRLEYADARSAQAARRATLLGVSSEPADPLYAVELVDTLTRLSVDVSDPEVLRVSLESERDQDPD